MSSTVRIALLLLATAASLVVGEAIALAHDIGQPHVDPPPPQEDGDSASPVIIVVVVVMTLAVAGFLVWAKQRAVSDDGDDPAAPAE